MKTTSWRITPSSTLPQPGRSGGPRFRTSGTHLLVMEYIEGAIDLAKFVKQSGPLPVAQACEYIRQAALGLQHAFEKRIVHRDIITPATIILTQYRRRTE
jgi:serine/threonine protein kinase